MNNKYLLYKLNKSLFDSDSSYILDIENDDSIHSHIYYLVLKKAREFNISKVTLTRTFLLYLQDNSIDVDVCDSNMTETIINGLIKSILDKKVISNSNNIRHGLVGINDNGYRKILLSLERNIKPNKNQK